MWGYQGTFSWDGRNIQPWAVVAQPSYFSHAFSLATCPYQQESEEFVSAAPPLSQRGSREASQKPAVMLGENAAERGLACGLHINACVHRLLHINILKKKKDSLL